MDANILKWRHKMNLKKAALIGLCCTIITTSTSFAVTDNINTNSDVKIQFNNEWIQLINKPFIENDRIMVTLNELAEKLGAKVESDINSGIIKMYSEYITIELSVGKNSGKVIINDGGTLQEQTFNMEVAPKITEEIIYVPLRFIAEALGYDVEWDNYLRAVIIREEGDIITIERPIEFHVVNMESIRDNALLLNLYDKNHMTPSIYSLIDGNYIYVLVAAGEKPTGGYSIEIDSITEVTQGTAYIHATLNSPGEGSIVTQVLTYPSAMVKFEKGDIECIQWDLYEDANFDEAEKIEVIKFVEDFGEQLKMVSLLAPEDLLKEYMNEYYKDFVSEELIEKWLKDPVKAPGKLTSSPWPECIDVLSVEKIEDNKYRVHGSIIELTSVEAEHGGIAATREITLEVNKKDDKWVIVDVKLGEYEVEEKQDISCQ